MQEYEIMFYQLDKGATVEFFSVVQNESRRNINRKAKCFIIYFRKGMVQWGWEKM